jgi:hypothetical protein
MAAKTGVWQAGTRLRRRRLLVFLTVSTTLAAALVGVTSGFTSLETYGVASTVAEGAPAWSTPCFLHEPRPDRRLLSRCARATGVVASVRAKSSPGFEEVHFALVGRFGMLIVKLGDPETLETPGLGSRVTVIGVLVRARNDMREIEAWSLS